MTRRQVLAATAGAIPAMSLLTVGSVSPARAPPPELGAGAAYCFFDPTEASFIEAACARLIPGDSTGPGARDARVPEFLDRHLAGAWGSGERLYRTGQWQPGTPFERHQLSKPADLFRAALSAIHRDLSARGESFALLPPGAQDRYLAALEAGVPLPGIATAAFFDLLLLMTTEAFFAVSAAAGLRERLPWPLREFPGACASATALGHSPRNQETTGNIP